MEFTTLGRTNLTVSRVGLGCGGHSRLGLALGKPESDAVSVVQSAIDQGVTFIDTAEAYGTEDAVGKAISGCRDQLVVSTKAGVHWEDRPCTADQYESRVYACLKRLGTDYIDLFNIHGVAAKDYDYATSELLPVLQRLKAQGVVRHIGITETFGPDPQHTMLSPAVRDPYWDVVMVGFNILNQSARERVLPHTMASGTGTLAMFAVRKALSDRVSLSALVGKLVQDGALDASLIDVHDPLGFLVTEFGAVSVVDAAYRYCRHEPGMDVVLTGTSRVDHLRDNIASIGRPALPEPCLDRLRIMFAGLDSVSGN